MGVHGHKLDALLGKCRGETLVFDGGALVVERTASEGGANLEGLLETDQRVVARLASGDVDDGTSHCSDVVVDVDAWHYMRSFELSGLHPM